MSLEHDSTDRIADLEREVAELRALVAGLTAASQVATAAPPALAAPVPDSGSAVEPLAATDPGPSRRGVLRLLGAATVGAVVTSATTASRAAADNGDTMRVGNTNADGGITGVEHRATNRTRFDWVNPVDASGVGFLFQAGALNTLGSVPSALAGWTSQTGTPNGVYGYTQIAGGAGVVAVGGTSQSVGLLARGLRANLRLDPAGTAPATRGDAHELGEVLCDANGDVWVCVAGGTPGTWRKIAGLATGGAFHAITPSRVYDSRSAQPSGNVGLLTNGTSRIVRLADQRDLTTGAIVVADRVPEGATAVTANVTVTDTQGAGFLAINPGGDDTIYAAAINWSGSGQILNNGLNLTLNNAREVTIVCGGGGNTHVVVDITGYFR